MRRSGLTLIELLVTAGLALLVMTLASRFFWPLVRIVIRSQERAGLQQRCTLAMDSLRGGLQATNPGGLAYTPGLLVLHPLDVRAVATRPRYLVELWSFHHTGGELRRQRWQPVPSALGLTLTDDAASRLTPSQLTLLPTLGPPADQRLLTSGVTEFNLSSSAPAPQLANPVRLRLVLAHQDDRYACEQTVLLRNSL